MTQQKKQRVMLHPLVKDRFDELKDAYQKNPESRNGTIYAHVRQKLDAIQYGAKPEHRLENKPHTGDLSDCWTHYLYTTERAQEPDYRIVTQPRPRTSYSDPPVQLVVGIGPREAEAVYVRTGQNLERTPRPGMSLEQTRDFNRQKSRRATEQASHRAAELRPSPGPQQHQEHVLSA